MVPYLHKRHAAAVTIAAIVSLFALQAASAREDREITFEHQAQTSRHDAVDDADDDNGTAAFDARHVKLTRNIAYGNDPAQRFDVYSPQQLDDKPVQGAPVIFMVHGGGWRRGDKAMRSVVESKVKRWVGRGFIVVSANYRMLPKAAPVAQAQDVARALAVAQEKAASWGGDRGKFILMGHSAGAHLVSLIAASPSLTAGIEGGVTPWLGTIALDSAAYDVVKIMEGKHVRVYDNAFGNVASYWNLASPYHAMTKAIQPFLAVCSTRREESCEQAERFVSKVVSLGSRASVLRENLSHREINQSLGAEESYTGAVEKFMRTLDPAVERLLQ